MKFTLQRGIALMIAGEALLAAGLCFIGPGVGIGVAGFLCFMDGVAVLAELSPAKPKVRSIDQVYIRDVLDDGTTCYYQATHDDIDHFVMGFGYDELHEDA